MGSRNLRRDRQARKRSTERSTQILGTKCIKQMKTHSHMTVDFLHSGHTRLHCARSARERWLRKGGPACRFEKELIPINDNVFFGSSRRARSSHRLTGGLWEL